MFRTEKKTVAKWRNYHRTILREDVAATTLADEGGPAGIGPILAETARLAGHALEEAITAGTGVLPVGSAWSFSDLLSGDGGTLACAPAGRIAGIERTQAGPAVDDAMLSRLVLAQAGTTVHDLNRWLEPRLSLVTSGAHDGQTLGGMTGTGTHGSAVDAGAFQNQVQGMHLVTAPGRSVWVERGPEPLLDPAFAATFADESRLDPDTLDAARVHLGGLGIVNAVLLEVSDGFTVEVVRRRRVLGAPDLEALANGDFATFADRTWTPNAGRRPYYVEVILDPFHTHAGLDADPRPALITLLHRRPPIAGAVRGPAEPARDALNLLAEGLERTGAVGDLLIPPSLVARIVASQFRDEPDDGAAPARLTWGQANGPHRRPGLGPVEVDLYNAAFALPRQRLADALPVMLAAFRRKGGGHQVLTLRFVEQAEGLLAFTRFPQTVIVNMDGLRTDRSREAARRVALALETAGVPFSQHWGKQGLITPSRFRRDFGDPSDPGSRAGRWRGVRESLLQPDARPALRNRAIIDWGLA